MELPDLELKLCSVVGVEADVTTVVGVEADVTTVAGLEAEEVATKDTNRQKKYRK